ncbi:MAG: Ig-like domain-containing protein [Terracidiphilus sp.]
MRGFHRRGLRLQLVAAFSIALVLPALASAVESTQRQASQTALTVQTRDQDGRTQATLAVSVTGEDGLPATGAVAITDDGKSLAGAALNAKGQASIVLTLPAGDHSLTATYNGDASHLSSASEPAATAAAVTSTPGFTITVSPATLSLTPGQSGTVTTSITPVNSNALSAPMFITLSCSGLPDQASCSFTPENIEILPNATAAIAVPMVIGTQEITSLPAHPSANSVAWAFLLPGTLALGGLAWSTRRRAWLSRLSLLALVGFVAMLGTTACAPRYDYYNHGPPIPPATPAGNYTVTVTAQASNGVTAITSNATLALTVK